MTEERAQDVLSFWLDDVGPDRWYASDPALDADITERFAVLWRQGAAGELDAWLTRPQGALALIILLDQFPRNMFRGQGRAFSTDCKALAKAKKAIALDFDLAIDEPARQFFYLPLMHSECVADQDRCVRLIKTRMPETGAHNLPFAREHRDVIRRFGRFPYRNAALGRATTRAESDYLANLDTAA